MQTIVLHFCYFVLILLFSTAYNTSLIYCFVIWCLHTNKRRPCSSTLSGHPSSSCLCNLSWKFQLVISSHCCFLSRLLVSRTIVDHMVWSFLALRHSWSRAVGCCSAWLVKWLVDWDSLFAVRKLFTPQCATSNNKPTIWKWFAEPIWSSGWFIIGTT